LFKISRLITTPNPGTNSLPFGIDGTEVVGVVPFDVVVGGGALAVGGDAGVLVLPDEAAGGAVVVSAVGAGEAGMSGGGASIGGGSGGGSGAGAGCIASGVAGTLIGLAGLIGLLTFVGLVALFVHVFDDSIQGDTTG
jgi:hypothetical protein